MWMESFATSRFGSWDIFAKCLALRIHTASCMKMKLPRCVLNALNTRMKMMKQCSTTSSARTKRVSLSDTTRAHYERRRRMVRLLSSEPPSVCEGLPASGLASFSEDIAGDDECLHDICLYCKSRPGKNILIGNLLLYPLYLVPWYKDMYCFRHTRSEYQCA